MDTEASCPFLESAQADCEMGELILRPSSPARTHDPSPIEGSATLPSDSSAGSVPNNPDAGGIHGSIEASCLCTNQGSNAGSVSQASHETSDGMIVQLRVTPAHKPPASQDFVEDVQPNSDTRQYTPPTNASALPQTAATRTRSTASAPTRMPTLRALLQRSTEIRRDNVEAPAPPRVEMPRPKAMDIETIDALYEAGGDWSQLAASIDRARPYALPRARYVMVIETGHAFQRTAPSKILASLLKDQGNPVVQQQIDQQQLGQLTKAPGGNIRVKVKTKEACQSLAGQEVKILGGRYRFGGFDILADRFFIDVSSVDSDFDADLMLKRFFELGTQPIYGTFRDVNLDAVITTATWRVYFRSSHCPPELVISGTVCDQLVFAGRIYPVHTKNAPFPTQRMSFGQRSIHALDLARDGGPSSDTSQRRPDKCPSQPSYAAVVRRGVQETSLQRSIREDSATITAIVAAPTDTLEPSELSLSTAGSQVVSPPSSPTSSPLLLLPPPPTAQSELVPRVGGKRKGKRSRADGDFANMLMKSRPKPLTGVTTSNYFDVLSNVEVEFDCCPATLDEVEIPRFQIVPRKVQAPRNLTDSKEASHFLTKHHTRVVKTKEPTPIQEIVSEMEATEQTADLQLLPDRLAAADTMVSGLRKSLRTTNNPDTLTFMGSVKAPMAFNTALLREMRELSPSVTELAQLHMINRILSATDNTETNTFARKWAKYLGTKVPKTRDGVFRCVAQWWNNPDTPTIVRATRALSLFELMLMCTAPQIFEKDYWLQRLTGWSVPWIPAHNRRLLHPNMLLVLLRSEIGTHCFKIWEAVQWQGDILEDLEYLRDCGHYFPENADVLQLQQVDGQSVLVTGPLALRC